MIEMATGMSVHKNVVEMDADMESVITSRMFGGIVFRVSGRNAFWMFPNDSTPSPLEFGSFAKPELIPLANNLV